MGSANQPPGGSPITDERLKNIGSTLSTLFKNAPAIAGMALGPSAALGFVGEMAFKFISLGFSINKARKQAAVDLDAAVRALDLPRERILVDLSDDLADQFARDGTFRDDFPEIAEAFRAEIDEVRAHPPAAVSARTRRRIAFASKYIPELVDGGRFELIQLQAQFGQFLHPVEPDYYRLICEMEQLLPSPEVSVNAHLSRRTAYFQQTLELARYTEQQMTAMADQALENTVSGLILDSIFGDAGGLSKTMGFLTTLKKTHINEEIANYKELKASIQDADADAKQKKAEIDDRVAKLTAWVGRLG